MDWTLWGVDVITALTVPVTFLIVWALKALWAEIPAAWLLIATPIVGDLINFGLTWFAGQTFSPVVGAVLGLLAIALREFLTTLPTKGLSGKTTPTKYRL